MLTTFGLLDVGGPEMLVILALVALVFGGKKLPEMSRNFGKSIGELKGEVEKVKELKEDFTSEVVQAKQSLRGNVAVPPRTARMDGMVSRPASTRKEIL